MNEIEKYTTNDLGFEKLEIDDYPNKFAHRFEQLMHWGSSHFVLIKNSGKFPIRIFYDPKTDDCRIERIHIDEICLFNGTIKNRTEFQLVYEWVILRAQ